MLENLKASGGELATERVSLALAERLGRGVAHDVVAEAVTRTRARESSLVDELASDERVDLSREELEAALDPATYLGQAETLVDAALR
jgi:3-carboxy-cis,cis-muconate cycloisomerase